MRLGTYVERQDHGSEKEVIVIFMAQEDYQRPTSYERLRDILHPIIETVARNELGQNYLNLVKVDKKLELRLEVKVDTILGHHRDSVQALRGWITLFDTVTIMETV